MFRRTSATVKKRDELIQGHPLHQWMYLSTRSIINALLPRNMQSNILQLRSIYGTSGIMGQRWRDDGRQSGRNERSLRLLAKVFVPSQTLTHSGTVATAMAGVGR